MEFASRQRIGVSHKRALVHPEASDVSKAAQKKIGQQRSRLPVREATPFWFLLVASIRGQPQRKG